MSGLGAAVNHQLVEEESTTSNLMAQPLPDSLELQQQQHGTESSVTWEESDSVTPPSSKPPSVGVGKIYASNFVSNEICPQAPGMLPAPPMGSIPYFMAGRNGPPPQGISYQPVVGGGRGSSFSIFPQDGRFNSGGTDRGWFVKDRSVEGMQRHKREESRQPDWSRRRSNLDQDWRFGRFPVPDNHPYAVRSSRSTLPLQQHEPYRTMHQPILMSAQHRNWQENFHNMQVQQMNPQNNQATLMQPYVGNTYAPFHPRREGSWLSAYQAPNPGGNPYYSQPRYRIHGEVSTGLSSCPIPRGLSSFSCGGLDPLPLSSSTLERSLYHSDHGLESPRFSTGQDSLLGQSTSQGHQSPASSHQQRTGNLILTQPPHRRSEDSESYEAGNVRKHVKEEEEEGNKRNTMRSEDGGNTCVDSRDQSSFAVSHQHSITTSKTSALGYCSSGSEDGGSDVKGYERMEENGRGSMGTNVVQGGPHYTQSQSSQGNHYAVDGQINEDDDDNVENGGQDGCSARSESSGSDCADGESEGEDEGEEVGTGERKRKHLECCETADSGTADEASERGEEQGGEVDRRKRKRRERWLKADHEAFLHGLDLYGRKWKMIQRLLPRKSLTQIRTHAYGYFAKLMRRIAEPNNPNDPWGPYLPTPGHPTLPPPADHNGAPCDTRMGGERQPSTGLSFPYSSAVDAHCPLRRPPNGGEWKPTLQAPSWAVEWGESESSTGITVGGRGEAEAQTNADITGTTQPISMMDGSMKARFVGMAGTAWGAAGLGSGGEILSGAESQVQEQTLDQEHDQDGAQKRRRARQSNSSDNSEGLVGAIQTPNSRSEPLKTMLPPTTE